MKKIIACFIVIIFAFSFAVLFAEANDALTFKVSSCDVLPGTDIEVCVDLINNESISSTRAKIYYPDVLTLIDYDFNIVGLSDGYVMSSVSDPKYDENGDYVIINWLSNNGRVDGDCRFITLKFHVSENSEGIYDILFVPNRGDVFNYRMEDLDYNIEQGSVNISSPVETETTSPATDTEEPTTDAVTSEYETTELATDTQTVSVEITTDIEQTSYVTETETVPAAESSASTTVIPETTVIPVTSAVLPITEPAVTAGETTTFENIVSDETTQDNDTQTETTVLSETDGSDTQSSEEISDTQDASESTQEATDSFVSDTEAVTIFVTEQETEGIEEQPDQEETWRLVLMFAIFCAAMFIVISVFLSLPR